MNLEEIPIGTLLRKQFKNVREVLSRTVIVRTCCYCSEIIYAKSKVVRFEAGSDKKAYCHLECYKDDPNWYVDYINMTKSSERNRVSFTRSKDMARVRKRTMTSNDKQELLNNISKVILELRATYLSVGLDLISLNDSHRGGYQVIARIGNHTMEDEFFHNWSLSCIRNRILQLIAELGTYVRKIEDAEGK